MNESLPPFIDSDSDLDLLLDQCAGDEACCLDTEADSLYVYRERLCLIQFSYRDQSALIDPLAIKKFDRFCAFVNSRPIWMHGADYDMSIWRRRFDEIPPQIFDTQIAARMVGYRKFGLAHLIEDVFGVTLPKGSQRANWGKRPLPDKMLEYAANDVRYLLPLAEHLEKRLHELGRWEWFVESCEAARSVVLNRKEKTKDDLWRIPGWGKLPPRGMAYLRAIWQWRDEIAEERNRPPFKVLTNDLIFRKVSQLLDEVSVSLPERFSGGAKRRFKELIDVAKNLPEKELPRRQRAEKIAKAGDWESVFSKLRDRRNEVANALDLESSLIASRAALERFSYATERTGSLQDELFLDWQKALLFSDHPVEELAEAG